MTWYNVIFYCDDELATGYTHTMRATNGDPVGAAERVFEILPSLPGNIIGVVVVPTYLH